MENLSTPTVLKDRLSSAAVDIMQKIDSTVQSMGMKRPTEDDPQNFKVTHRGGALVRSGRDTDTPQVHQLSAGEVVTVVELAGRRARIISPVEGWMSVETKDGVQIMRPCHLQTRQAQSQAFERSFEKRFARLKAQQDHIGGAGGGYDARPKLDRSFSPRRMRGNSPGWSDRDSDHEYHSQPPLRRNRNHDSHVSRGGRPKERDSRREDSGHDAPVPRLAAPTPGGSASIAPPPTPPAPAQLTQEINLLDLDDKSMPASEPTFDVFGGTTSSTPSSATGGAAGEWAFNPSSQPTQSAPSFSAWTGTNQSTQPAQQTQQAFAAGVGQLPTPMYWGGNPAAGMGSTAPMPWNSMGGVGMMGYGPQFQQPMANAGCAYGMPMMGYAGMPYGVQPCTPNQNAWGAGAGMQAAPSGGQCMPMGMMQPGTR